MRGRRLCGVISGLGEGTQERGSLIPGFILYSFIVTL